MKPETEKQLTGDLLHNGSGKGCFSQQENQRFCGQSASETLIFFYYKSWFFLWE